MNARHLAVVLGLCSAFAVHGADDEPAITTDVVAAFRAPVGGFRIGGDVTPNVANPYANDPDAVVQGRTLFNEMNCSGCHAAEGGGGMGPPLSDRQWIYGGEPANVFMSIWQGRPNGMPSFQNIGSEAIWRLVAYVRTLDTQPR